MEMMDPIDYSRGRNNSVSKKTFKSMKVTIPGMKLRILELINGELSTWEIANILGIELHKISGRFSELVNANKIILKKTKRIGRSSFSVFIKI